MGHGTVQPVAAQQQRLVSRHLAFEQMDLRVGPGAEHVGQDVARRMRSAVAVLAAEDGRGPRVVLRELNEIVPVAEYRRLSPTCATIS